MKALSLTAPWSDLIIAGAKRVESRSWSTRVHGPIAIHTAKGYPKYAKEFTSSDLVHQALRGQPPIVLGAVIGIASIVDCRPVADIPKEWLDRGNECEFGDYSEGRYGWLLSNPSRLPVPIPYKGKLGLWELPVEYCDSCDGVGLMEGWNRRDGHSCPKCKGNAIALKECGI